MSISRRKFLSTGLVIGAGFILPGGSTRTVNSRGSVKNAANAYATSVVSHLMCLLMAIMPLMKAAVAITPKGQILEQISAA